MQSEFLLRRSRGLEAAISGPQLARASHVCGCSTFARPGQLAPGERESNIRVPVFAFVSAQGAYSPHVRTFPFSGTKFTRGTESVGGSARRHFDRRLTTFLSVNAPCTNETDVRCLGSLG